MKQFILLVFCLFQFIGFGQMEFSLTKHDFGDLESYDNRFVDLEITNHGSKQGYILSVRKPSEVVYIQNHALIAKDSTVTVRFQVNPKQKGRFNYEIQVFTSDKGEATIVKLSGNLKSIGQNATSSLTACPDFNSHPAGRKANSFEMTVITIDKETREELSQSTVSMIQGGKIAWSSKTDKRGKIRKEGTIGLAYFHAKHMNYLPAEKGAFVSNERNQIIIELEKDPKKIDEPPLARQDEIVIEIEPTKPDTPAVPETPVVTSNEIVVETPVTPSVSEEIEWSTEETTNLEVETPIALTEIPSDNFDESYFKPVNVTFVLDISSSMIHEDRLELMKYSLNQLSDMLRPQDKVTIVTYATDTKILLPTMPGSEKEAMQTIVGKLKASGMTAGGEGIKMGYKQAEKAFIQGGVNHVIIITDGGFNKKSEDFKKYIEEGKKKGIELSVVGIKNQEKDVASMKEIAALGGGTYIPIFKLIDAQENLRQAIRVLSFVQK